MPAHELEPCGAFVLRVAALALDELPTSATLDRLFERPDVIEALVIASPSLLRVIEQRRRDPSSKKGRAATRTLLRYANRMASRPTPFGTFAGHAVGRIAEATALELRSRDAWTRTTQLDIGWLRAVARRLTLDDRFRDHVELATTDALHRGPLHTRWPVRRSGEHFPSHYVSVDSHATVDAIIARAADGATFAELVAACTASDRAMTPDEASQTVSQLFGASALVSSLEPPTTGAEPPLAYLRSRLAASPSGHAICTAIDGVCDSLEALDARGIGAAPAAYEAVAAAASRTLEAPDRPQLRVDLRVTPVHAALSAATTRDVLDAVCSLARVMGRTDDLDRFRAAYARRFENAPQGVPLLDLLDEVDGVMSRGHEAVAVPELLKGVPVAPVERRPTWGRRERWLLAMLEAAWSNGSHEIVLRAADLNDFDGPALPDCFSALLEVYEQPGGSDRVFLAGLSTPTGARTFTRLGRCSADVSELARALVDHEQSLSPNAAFAEVIASGEGADLQPSYRPYEIPLGGRSGAPPARQIHARELTVFVESGEIILWCERLGKRVIPRVTSALAVEAITRPSLYWFLGNLQHQGRLAGASWDWGPLAHAGFLPRVCIGTVIVSLASWKLPRAWPGAWKAGDGERRIAMVRALRDQRGIPRRVAVASAGERIFVDLDDASSTEVGFEMFDSADDAPRLTELVPGSSVPAVRSEYGRHMSEILLPFRRRGARPRVTEPRAPANDTRPVPHGGGVVLPGAEWLYLRLAIPASSTDRILYEVVRPLVQRRGRELHDWFFVRHLHDGAPELRLRFHGDPDFLWRELLRGLHAGVARCGAAVHGVRIDTYERELSRYGGEVGTQLVESLACCDSDWVIGLLDAPASAADLDRLRFEIALLSVRRLIDDFALDLHQRHRLFAARHAAMVPELAAKTRHAIAAKLHDLRSASVELPAAVAGETARLLDARSASVRSIVAALRDARLDDRVLPSVLHHAMCRILTGHEFAQELAAYALLLRESERDVRRT